MPVSSVIRPGDDKDNPVARKNSDSVGITGKLEIYLTNQASVETDDVYADNTREEMRIVIGRPAQDHEHSVIDS